MRYLYYKLYQNLKTIKTNTSPAFAAMLLISILEAMNVLSVYMVLKQFVKFSINDSTKAKAELHGVLLGLAILAINYFFLFRNRKEIYERYKNESKQKSKTGYILLVVYAIGSFVLVMTLGKVFVG